MNNTGEMSDEEFGEKLKEELKLKYRLGDDLDFYLVNTVILDLVFECIRQDSDDQLLDADCLAELKRLCEPSVRHYFDCACPICR